MSKLTSYCPLQGESLQGEPLSWKERGIQGGEFGLIYTLKAA